MRKVHLGIPLGTIAVGTLAIAQMGQWTTWGHDPQRSGFAAEEHAFSTANVSGMGLEWKTTVPNQPLSMNGLTSPLVVRGMKTAQGEKNLVIAASSSASVSTSTTESSGPNGSAWCSDQFAGGASTQAGAM